MKYKDFKWYPLYTENETGIIECDSRNEALEYSDEILHGIWIDNTIYPICDNCAGAGCYVCDYNGYMKFDGDSQNGT